MAEERKIASNINRPDPKHRQKYNSIEGGKNNTRAYGIAQKGRAISKNITPSEKTPNYSSKIGKHPIEPSKPSINCNSNNPIVINRNNDPPISKKIISTKIQNPINKMEIPKNDKIIKEIEEIGYKIKFNNDVSFN